MDLSSKALTEKKAASHVHYLPCSTEYNGSAEVDKYFTQSVNEGNGEEKGEESLRVVLAVGGLCWC